MTRTTVEITTNLRDELKVLKGVLQEPNYDGTIRRIMKSAGYTEAFFEKMEKLGVGKE